MSVKNKKTISWIIGFVILGFIFASELSTGTKTALIVGMILFWIINEQEKRYAKTIQTVAKYIDDKDGNKPTSYKIDFVIMPNWHEITKHLAKELKVSHDEFQKEILDNKKLGIVEGKGLFGKGFRFVYFYNAISGLEQIWSEHDKTFLDEMEINESILANEDGGIWGFMCEDLPEKFLDSKIFVPIVITPYAIGFDTARLVGYSEDIQLFPFGSITSFFKDLYINIGLWGPMYKIKSFPKELEEEFKKHKVKYEDWDYEDWGTFLEAKDDLIESEWAKKHGVQLYNQKMRNQIFTTPFMTVSIKIEFF